MMYLEGESNLNNESNLSIRDLLIELLNKKSGEEICVIHDKDELTINMLLECAECVASYLCNESLVGICMDLSLELIIVLCGLILCGVPYVPLEPRLPFERLTYIINDSKASIIIISDENNKLLLNINTKIINYKNLLMNKKIINKKQIINEEDIFCIMYTSGSTGLPKGVRLPYRALINRLNWQWKIFPFNSSDVCCLKTSISFVDSIAEIFAPLLKGIQLIIIQKSLLLDIKQFLSVLINKKITRIILVPSLLNVIIQYLSIENQIISNLRFIICSGETLSPNLIKLFFNTFKTNCQLINLYGSTEVMADVTYEIFSSLNDLNIKCIDGRTSIGIPIDNMRIDIINQDDDDIGELLISGPGVASGYHHGEMLTDKFIPDINNNKKLSFRTGDMGKIWNQRIILYGRCDNQVKIAGNRVNLNEIELILKIHCNCQQPIALLINSEIIVFLEDNEKSINLDRNILTRYLPKYAIPSSFIKIDHLPLLVSGKIDRNELEHYFLEKNSFEQDLSRKKLGKFSHILEEFGIQQSNIDKNFFAAGGSSLNALLLVAKLHSVGFNNITVERLISAPTLRDIQFDLFSSTNETIKYFQEEIDDTSNFHFISLEHVNKQNALEILTESFVTHGEVDTLIHKHQIELKNEFIKQWGNSMNLNWNNYLLSNLSFGVINQNNQLMGLSLSYDISNPLPIQTQTTLLTPLTTMIDIPLQNRLHQLKTSENLTRIMHSHVTTVDPNLTPGQRLTIIYFIEKHLLDVAKNNGYQAVITANTSSVTQQLAEHVLKYDTNHTTLASQSYDPSTGKLLFPDAPNHYTVTISVKYI